MVVAALVKNLDQRHLPIDRSSDANRPEAPQGHGLRLCLLPFDAQGAQCEIERYSGRDFGRSSMRKRTLPRSMVGWRGDCWDLYKR